VVVVHPNEVAREAIADIESFTFDLNRPQTYFQSIKTLAPFYNCFYKNCLNT